MTPASIASHTEPAGRPSITGRTACAPQVGHLLLGCSASHSVGQSSTTESVDEGCVVGYGPDLRSELKLGSVERRDLRRQ